MIDISIVIPVYNAGDFIHTCLDSIVAQEGKFMYEIILVDDGSTDNSVDVIQQYEKSEDLVMSGGRIVLMQQQNAGPSKARNRAIEAARGRYLAFIDADDYWKPEFFKRTVDFLDKHEECIGVSVLQQVDTVSGTHVSPVIPNDGLSEKEASRYADGYIIKDFFRFWGERMHICPGGAMMRTDVVKATGGMREDLRITEDLEFWGYSALFGKWGLIPEVLFMGCGAQTVTSREDWIRRMKRRWDNAPTVEEWEKRLVRKQPNLLNDESYHVVQGAIARNLAYCQLLSGRTKLARTETIKYSKYITKDSIGKLMGLVKWSSLTWWGVCKFLKWREWHRK